MKVVAATLLLLLPITATGATRARYLMGTVCEITAPNDRPIEAAFDEAARVEKFLSTWDEASELSRLNHNGAAVVSPELYALLEMAMRWRERTGGAFDPLIGPLVEAWRIRSEGAAPDDATIARALASMRSSNVIFRSPSSIQLHGCAAFEEGAFGKGYAIDRMLAVLDTPQGVVNFGGQLGIRGTSSVTIADPERRDRPVIAFSLRDASLSTSSGSEKSFVAGGRHFSHLIDPRTGQALPPRGSASVVCDDALTADILSTALYVMGPSDGLRWANVNRIAVVFVTPDHQITASDEFRRRAGAVELLDRRFTLKD
jgi:FAD:protein FMN transferase